LPEFRAVIDAQGFRELVAGREIVIEARPHGAVRLILSDIGFPEMREAIGAAQREQIDRPPRDAGWLRFSDQEPG
jgi:hypothetical protein